MKWNYWIRQIHRLLSIAFTVAIIVTFIALRQEKPPVWVNLLALPPLFLLLHRSVLVRAAVCSPVGAAGDAPTR